MKMLMSLIVCSLITLPAWAADIEEVSKEAVGAWQLEFTTPDYEKREPIVIVGRQHQELVAWYIDDAEPQSFSEVKLVDEELKLTFRPKKFDDEVLVTFASKLKESGVCEGDINYETDDGDTGSFEFKGKRIELAEFDKTSEWDLEFVTPDGEQREATVTALFKNDNLYGWYSSEDFELPAKKITKEGDEVALSIDVTTEEGVPVSVTFEGTLEGDEITGNAEYTFRGENGSFPFSGKRASK